MIRYLLILLVAGCLSQESGSAYAEQVDSADTFWQAKGEVQRLPPVEFLPPTDQPILPQPSSSEASSPSANQPAPAPHDPVANEAVPEISPEQSKPVALWNGAAELGFDGSEGNSDTLNFRFGIDAKRKTDLDILELDLDYRKTTADSRETANRLFLDGRQEWLLEESRWTWFLHQTTEYDEFKAYDVRVTLDTGIGYQFIKTETTSLMGRSGSGISREIGGPDESFVPELAFGLDWEQQLTERQKMSASSEYMPDLTGFADFRLNTKASWEVLLDETWNLSLRLTVLDRYDSTPNGVRPNDLDYSTTLLWSF